MADQILTFRRMDTRDIGDPYSMYNDLVPMSGLSEDLVYLMHIDLRDTEEYKFVTINSSFAIESIEFGTRTYSVGFMNDEWEPVYYDGPQMDEEDPSAYATIYTCFTYSKSKQKCTTHVLRNVDGKFYADEELVRMQRIIVLQPNGGNVNTESFVPKPLSDFVPVEWLAILAKQVMFNYSSKLRAETAKLREDHNKAVLDSQAETQRPMSLVRVPSSDGRTIYVYPFMFWHLIEEQSLLYRNEYGCEEEIVDIPVLLFGSTGLPYEVTREFLRMLATDKLPTYDVLMSLGLKKTLQTFVNLADYFSLALSYTKILRDMAADF